MPVHLYNSLTGRKELFTPADGRRVRMYSCGPTVYNYFHIGNARAFVVFDMVRRYLRYRGYDVTFVQNFTDVDDKLIARANELETTVDAVSSRYIEAYYEDAAALGIQPADAHPRVTAVMDDIIAFIAALVDKGYAYEAGGDVFYETARFSDYGKLSGQTVADLRVGSRVDVSEWKRHPEDFVLWKAAKSGEPAWNSPWGQGRPGWHIECSAMIHRYLGEHIDIHGGGHDLMFPHHENEIAQSEGRFGAPLARWFMHNGYVNINNEKMSKSLGNSVFVHDLVRRYDPRAVRMFLLSSHYRNPVNYSEEVMAQMVSALQRIDSCLDHLELRAKEAHLPEGLPEDLAPYETRLVRAMDDDINTGDAMGALFDLVRDANIYLRGETVSKAGLRTWRGKLDDWLELFGFSPRAAGILDEDVEQMVAERTALRKARDFAAADRIRERLRQLGIELEDTAQGVRWRRAQ